MRITHIRLRALRLENKRDGIERDLERFYDMVRKCKAFMAAAKEKGLELPHELSSVGIPF